MPEKRFSECRDCWIVVYDDDINTFDTEDQADDFINKNFIC